MHDLLTLLSLFFNGGLLCASAGIVLRAVWRDGGWRATFEEDGQ